MAAKRAAAKSAKRTASKRSSAPAKVAKRPSPKSSSLRRAKPTIVAKRAVATPKPHARAAAVAKSAGSVSTVKAKLKAQPAKPQPAVSDEPKLTKSPLSKSELEHFRDLLLDKRKDLLGDVGSMESEAFKSGSNLSNMPIHMADVGTDNFEQEFTLGLIESERRILRDIQEALQRIESGTFGICLGTGRAIPKVRLEAVPWAKYTIDYSRALDQGLIRRDANQRPEKDDEDEE